MKLVKTRGHRETIAITPMMMSSQHYLLLLLLLISSLVLLLNISSITATSDDQLGITLPSTCQQRCGEVEISYPFGIGERCFLPGFEVTCNHNTTPFLTSTSLQLVEISLELGEVSVISTPFSASSCSPLFSYDEPNQQLTLLQNSPFMFSESNKFIVVGCNVGALISDTVNFTRFSGCKSNCTSWNSMDINGSCSGKGCCEVPVPGAQKSLSLYTYVVPENEETTNKITSCCKGFVAEEESYKFNRFDIWTNNENGLITGKLTTKLEWAIGEGRCDQDAKKDICGEHSHCDDSGRKAGGYLCKCITRYRGNPYLSGTSQGCTSDCDSVRYNPCVTTASCQYKDERYICICELGSSGDGLKNGSGCHAQFPLILVFKPVVLLTVLCLCILSLSHWTLKKRDQAQIRAQNFLQNGGLLLQQCTLSKYSTTIKPVKIFSARELEKATNKYDKRRVVGFGGQGTVYKGILINGTQVAIKKSHQLVAQSQVKQFINELFILSQINHRNIVKLLGCCLETQIPLLVYEFISGRSLYEKIHGDDHNMENLTSNLSWKERLRIAIEVAEALSYLHSYAYSTAIFHRDVKSSNILLNENGIAKLADFGVSRLVSVDKVGSVSTVVQGTIGYLDPEYFNTGRLTEKSDVYSYGVILLELLTRRKPIEHEDIRDYSSLVMQFKSHFGRNNLYKILDESLLEIRNMEELIVVARIAYTCLNVASIERPTMKTVVQELMIMQGSC